MPNIQELFAEKEYCLSELREARKLFTSKLTTPSQWDAMQKTLAFMYVYCPKDIQSLVDATMIEAEHRHFYFMTNIWI